MKVVPVLLKNEFLWGSGRPAGVAEERVSLSTLIKVVEKQHCAAKAGWQRVSRAFPLFRSYSNRRILFSSSLEPGRSLSYRWDRLPSDVRVTSINVEVAAIALHD